MMWDFVVGLAAQYLLVACTLREVFSLFIRSILSQTYNVFLWLQILRENQSSV